MELGPRWQEYDFWRQSPWNSCQLLGEGNDVPELPEARSSMAADKQLCWYFSKGFSCDFIYWDRAHGLTDGSNKPPSLAVGRVTGQYNCTLVWQQDLLSLRFSCPFRAFSGPCEEADPKSRSSRAFCPVHFSSSQTGPKPLSLIGSRQKWQN